MMDGGYRPIGPPFALSLAGPELDEGLAGFDQLSQNDVFSARTDFLQPKINRNLPQ